MAITRGVLSRSTEDRVIVNVQEVTNDESPPVINGAPSITLTPLEGAVHSTTPIATVQASDRLNFSFQKLSGPTEVTIDPNNGQIKTSKAVSKTASWNTPNSPGNSSTLKATDTAGNDSSLTTININPQYAGALASWATGESVSQSTNIISYDLSGNFNDTTFSYMDEAFNESEFAGYFDQLNINNSPGSTSTQQAGYGRVEVFVTDFSDDDAHTHIRTMATGGNNNVRLGLAQSGSFVKTWTSGDSLDVVFGLVPDNHYYYELITNPGSQGYPSQFGADELFRDAPDNCIRVRHSSDADDVTISTGQLVNIGTKRSTTYGISSTVNFPTGLINEQAIGSTAKGNGACYYAINNGDGTLSFATSRSNAIAQPPVKVQFSNSGWGGSYTDTSRTSIRIRPTALRNQTYTVSDPIEVTHTPTLANYTPPSWTSLSGTSMTVYYYIPTLAANAFTDVIVANISGGVGSHITSNPYTSFSGYQTDTSTPGVFKLRLPQNQTAPGTYVLSVSDQASGLRTVSYSVQPVSEIVLTSGNIGISSSYSSGVVTQVTCSGGNGAYTFAITGASSGISSNGLSINSSNGEISLNSGASTGSHTVSVKVTDSLGNFEDFNIPFAITTPVVQTITIQGVGSPTGGVNYYGYSGGLYGGSGSISPLVAPFASFVSGNVTLGVFYQTAFGSYNFYVNINNNGVSSGIPQNTFTQLTVDDGVNVRVFDTSSVYHGYSANIGSAPNRYSQWRWGFSPGDAQYQRIVNMSAGDTITLTFT